MLVLTLEFSVAGRSSSALVVLRDLARVARVQADLRHGLRVVGILINFRIKERRGSFPVVLVPSIRHGLAL
jgi:hypothetical protein